jgi:hypothetical protein
MRSDGFKQIAFLLICIAGLAGAARGGSLRVAILVPEQTAESEAHADLIGNELEGRVRILDRSLAGTAFLSQRPETPFNMTTDEARTVAAAIGCDFFLLVRSATLSRYSLARKQYFESYAAIYVVSGRTGRLTDFELSSFNGFNADDSARLLNEAVSADAALIAEKLERSAKSEMNATPRVPRKEVPEPESNEGRGFRSPVPYRRLSPKYTSAANSYSIAATVDIEVELDEKGSITRTEIVRWAGFGLDESVENAVRTMNWRPAERLGKFEPIRFLLRYNFRKVVKDEDEN